MAADRRRGGGAPQRFGLPSRVTSLLFPGMPRPKTCDSEGPSGDDGLRLGLAARGIPATSDPAHGCCRSRALPIARRDVSISRSTFLGRGSRSRLMQLFGGGRVETAKFCHRFADDRSVEGGEFVRQVVVCHPVAEIPQGNPCRQSADEPDFLHAK